MAICAAFLVLTPCGLFVGGLTLPQLIYTISVHVLDMF